MKILKEWLTIMGFKIEEITDDEIMIIDYAWYSEGEIIIKSIKDWCIYFIEIMEYKINQDREYIEMVQCFTEEIEELKKLGNIN